MSKAAITVEGKARVAHRETRNGKRYTEIAVNHIAKRKTQAGVFEDDGQWIRFAAKFWDGVDATGNNVDIADGAYVRLSGENLRVDSWQDNEGNTRIGGELKKPTVTEIAYAPAVSGGFKTFEVHPNRQAAPAQSVPVESAPF